MRIMKNRTRRISIVQLSYFLCDTLLYRNPPLQSRFPVTAGRRASRWRWPRRLLIIQACKTKQKANTINTKTIRTQIRIQVDIYLSLWVHSLILYNNYYFIFHLVTTLCNRMIFISFQTLFYHVFINSLFRRSVQFERRRKILSSHTIASPECIQHEFRFLFPSIDRCFGDKTLVAFLFISFS